MPDPMPPGSALPQALALSVGCRFGLSSTQPAEAILQVAPCPAPGISIGGERWHSEAEHHAYIDHYGNRCERFALASGDSQIGYEAQVVLMRAADAIEPDVPETPVALLPDEVLSYVMPSRFCLPDELGHEAWQRFGSIAPGWGRVQAIVDYVHDSLEFVAGASNPWTTAADAYRARQGVCRDFAHLSVALLRALNVPARLAAVFAPGLSPMEYHAVCEAYVNGAWYIIDGTHLAPRQSLLRVSTGRDAADTAFLTNLGGGVQLTGLEVTAVVDDFPWDDGSQLLQLV
jgi:transglutaminase-like putative cysteine protease